MKKKLLTILMATTMSMTLIACGGKEKQETSNKVAVEVETEGETTEAVAEEATQEVSGEFTEEQAALAQEYLDMCEAYDAAVEVVNATPELLEQQELVDVMNELTGVIIEADEYFADPATLTPEVMESLRTAFDETYKFIDEVNALASSVETTEADELASILTIAYGGADEEENTYYFACDENVTFGAIVILSADMTQNVNCVGEIIDNGDGTVTINDEEGYSITFMVEEAEGGVILTLEDGTVVGMAAWDAKEIIDMMLTIDTETENVN